MNRDFIPTNCNYFKLNDSIKLRETNILAYNLNLAPTKIFFGLNSVVIRKCTHPMIYNIQVKLCYERSPLINTN